MPKIKVYRIENQQSMKKNILILINTLKLGGGSQTVVSRLAKGFMNFGYKVKYLIFFPLKPYIKVDSPIYSLNEKHGGWIKNKENKLKSIIRRSKRLIDLTVIFPRIFRDFCKKNEINLIISFMEDANLISILSRKLFKNITKLIVSLRSNPKFSYKGFFDNLIYTKLLIKKLFKYSDFVVIPSKGMKKVLIDLGCENSHLKTIYNPNNIDKYIELSNVNIEKILNNKNLISDVIKNSFNFITIGRFEKVKGHLFLIKAFYEVIKKYPKIHLMLIGEGHLKLEILKYIRSLKIEKNITILGVKNNIFPYLKIADCLILPSITEGFPNILIEALSVNLPIISTDCESGPREILTNNIGFNVSLKYPFLGEYGILTRPFSLNDEPKLKFPLFNSEKSLADAMKLVLKNPELIERYSRGIERAKIFHTDEIIKDWINLFNQLNI